MAEPRASVDLGIGETRVQLHITPGPSVLVKREPAGEKWCFGCRERLPHIRVLLDDPPERQPSYYEPVWSMRCCRCGRDLTHFPGTGPL